LSRDQHTRIKASLVYDKRKRGGSFGRSITIEFPELGLEKGDRLEPSARLLDVSLFDRIDQFPCTVLFWRVSHESRTRHRNPLFDEAVGVTIDTLMVDKLHTLHLGPAQAWCLHTLWRLILADAFATNASGDALYQLSVQHIRHRLWAWYKEARRLRPDECITEVQDFTLSMLGGKPTAQILGTKAAETKGLVPYVLSLVREFGWRIPGNESQYLIGAGEALVSYFRLLDQSGVVVEPSSLQAMYDAIKRHVTMSTKAGISLKPKHHQVVHLVDRTEKHGSPSSYATFEDESINRVLKKVGEAAHRSVWEIRVLVQFAQVEDRMLSRKRARPSM
jgi:hypothetical protein